MVHQRQPDDTTCWITVVAMLADIPVEQLLADINEEFGVSYQEMHKLQANVGSDNEVAAVNAQNNLNEVASWIERRFGFDINQEQFGYIARDAFADRMKTSLKAVKLYSLPSGRGAISLYTGVKVIGSPESPTQNLVKHTVAYWDGMVFDPAFPKPMSLARFRHEYAKCVIDEMWEVSA